MTTQADNPSRRSLLAGMAAAPAILALGSAPALAASPVDRSAWDRALAEYEAAHAAHRAYAPTYDRAHEAWASGRQAIQEAMDALPWREFPYENRGHVARVMDVEQRWARFLAGEGKTWSAPPAQARQRKARYRAALDAVLEFRRKEAELEARSGLAEAEPRSMELFERLGAASGALLRLPAPDSTALLWKMEYLWLGDEESSWSAEVISIVLADARRLLLVGRA